MRRLMLLRHAKAAPLGGAGDLVRSLAPRGREAAPVMGAYLAREMLFPDLVLVSPSARTRETWALVAAALPEATSVRFEERIYEASHDRLLEIVEEVEAPARGVLMVGHNPGMADLARMLAGHGDRYAFARMREKFPTCGLAVIDFPVDDWVATAPGTGRLERFVTPDTLGVCSPEGD